MLVVHKFNVRIIKINIYSTETVHLNVSMEVIRINKIPKIGISGCPWYEFSASTLIFIAHEKYLNGMVEFLSHKMSLLFHILIIFKFDFVYSVFRYPCWENSGGYF